MDKQIEEVILETDYLVTEHAAIHPGEPIRLFPYGVMYKNGKRREITPALAAKFRLPHFRPPVKLGSHDDTTPAGGFITRVYAGDDGLYGETEWNERGESAMADGAYRYHSPEVIWEGALENPTDGTTIEGPMIVGLALLHTPHLGEAAALYSIEPFTKEQDEMSDTVNLEVPKSFWERLTAYLFPDHNEAEVETEVATPPAETEEMTALRQERDNLAARVAEIERQNAHAAKVEQYRAELAETKITEGAEMLADMTDEHAAWVIEKIKALSAQINEAALLGEVGTTGDGLPTDPKQALDTAVRARMVEKSLDYNTALVQVRAEQPELAKAAYPSKKRE